MLEGCEFYVAAPLGEAAGRGDGAAARRFGELQALFPAAVACGVVRRGHAMLAPPPQLALRPGDAPVLLCRDRAAAAARARAPRRGCSAEGGAAEAAAPGKVRALALAGEEIREGRRRTQPAAGKGYRVRPAPAPARATPWPSGVLALRWASSPLEPGPAIGAAAAAPLWTALLSATPLFSATHPSGRHANRAQRVCLQPCCDRAPR